MFEITHEPAIFFFKQKTAYEIGVRLVGSEMCIRDSTYRAWLGTFFCVVPSYATGIPWYTIHSPYFSSSFLFVS